MTSSAKTNLQIDKHYPNRAAMEANVKTDGVYAGRYVLIEYGVVGQDAFTIGYYSNNKFYYDNTFKKEIIPAEGILYSIIMNYSADKDASQYLYEIYIGQRDTQTGAMKLVSGSNAASSNAYISNYYVDKQKYPDLGQGYDSTVWQKIYEKDSSGNSIPKYINIASLNSVVPTFKLSVDPPEATPIAPHFGPNSSNVVYDLHVSPSWRFRVAAAKATADTAINNNDGWNGNNDDTWTNDEDRTNTKLNQAIYYNRKGFDEFTENTKDTTTENFISLKPTGISGQMYNKSETLGSTEQATAVDTQEFRLSLPAIGNMISQGWDIIHGPKRDDSPADSLQGRIDFFKNELNKNTIPVQTSGKYLVGATMSDDAWIATKIDSANKDISITHTFTAVNDTTSSSNKNGNGDTIALYTPHVDERGHVVGKNIETVTLPYGFKTITIGKAVSTTANGAGLSAIANLVADNTQDTITINPSNKWIRLSGTTDANQKETITIGHQVNTINTSAKSDTDLDEVGKITIQDLTFDEAGHVTANQNHQYALPHAFKYIAIDEISTSTTAGSGQAGMLTAPQFNADFTVIPQNRWITLKANEDGVNFEIGHAAAGAQKNTAGDTSAITAPAFGSSFNTTVVKYDETGHISGTSTRSVTFPIGSFSNPTPTGTTGNVLTSFEYTPSSGAITVNNRNLSSLLLTGYTATKTDSSYVQATDSLTQGINKIENRLDTTNTIINERIDNEVQSLNTIITNNVSTLNGRIDTEVQTLNTRVDNEVNTLNERIDTEVDALNTLIENEVQRATAAEEALGKRIDGILDGITEEELNTFKELSDALGDDANFAANVNKAIAANTNLINAESTRAQQAETANTNAINTEKTRAEGQEQAIREEFAQADVEINAAINNLKNGSTSTIKDLDDSIDTLEKNLDDTAKAIREEFAAADKATGEAVAAVSALVGETSVSNQIDAKLVDYITTDNLTTTLGDYYTKEEVNNELSNYSTSTVIAENYYNKSEVDNTLQNYAIIEQIPTDFYSKSEIDTTLESYAKIEQIPTDFYSKAEVDALIGELQTQIAELKALVESYHSTTEESTPEEEVTPEETPTE